MDRSSTHLTLAPVSPGRWGPTAAAVVAVGLGAVLTVLAARPTGGDDVPVVPAITVPDAATPPTAPVAVPTTVAAIDQLPPWTTGAPPVVVVTVVPVTVPVTVTVTTPPPPVPPAPSPPAPPPPPPPPSDDDDDDDGGGDDDD